MAEIAIRLGLSWNEASPASAVWDEKLQHLEGTREWHTCPWVQIYIKNIKAHRVWVCGVTLAPLPPSPSANCYKPRLPSSATAPSSTPLTMAHHSHPTLCAILCGFAKVTIIYIWRNWKGHPTFRKRGKCCMISTIKVRCGSNAPLTTTTCTVGLYIGYSWAYLFNVQSEPSMHVLDATRWRWLYCLAYVSCIAHYWNRLRLV